MGVKIGILLIALLAVCLADPLPNSGFVDNDHVDSGTRIIGGTPAAEGSVPYMVALTQGQFSAFVCGGSILSQRTVLTAAHCIGAVYWAGELYSTLRVTVGTNRWDPDSPDTGGQTLSVSRNITHPNYVAEPIIKNDIGFLVTSSNIIFSDVVVPAVLSYDFVDGGVVALAAGWGFTTGDSGSALVRVDNGRQIGVVSWGVPCARGAPDVFVRISAFRDWILEHLV